MSYSHKGITEIREAGKGPITEPWEHRSQEMFIHSISTRHDFLMSSMAFGIFILCLPFSLLGTGSRKERVS